MHLQRDGATGAGQGAPRVKAQWHIPQAPLTSAMRLNSRFKVSSRGLFAWKKQKNLSFFERSYIIIIDSPVIDINAI